MQDTGRNLFKPQSSNLYDELDPRMQGRWDATVEATERRLQEAKDNHERYWFRRQQEELGRVWNQKRAELQGARLEGGETIDVPTFEEVRATVRNRLDARLEQSMEKIRGEGQATLDKLANGSPKDGRNPDPTPERRMRMKP